jgi:hypothetical protein
LAEGIALNGTKMTIALPIFLLLLFSIYGELKRNILLRKLIYNKKLSRTLINCSEYRRWAKTILLVAAGMALCLSLADFKINLNFEGKIFSKILTSLKICGESGSLNVKNLFLELSFCLLTIEQLLGTRRR